MGRSAWIRFNIRDAVASEQAAEDAAARAAGASKTARNPPADFGPQTGLANTSEGAAECPIMSGPCSVA